jgi:hypothetical protein
MARRTDFSYLRRPTIGMRSYRRYREGPGIERPVARAVIAAVLGLFLLAFGLTRFFASAGPSQEALQLAHMNPLQLFEDPNPHFLGTPVAAIPAKKADLPPPAPAPASQAPDGAPTDLVKVVDPGGVGVLLRSAPTDGKLVASLQNGQTLQVLERRTVDSVDWLRVRTASGVEGWVFAGLVLPSY